MEKIEYTYRFFARFVVEAVTPLAIGNGEKSFLTDSLVALDANGLPYIPGTSLAGVVRHAIGESKAKEFFGIHESGEKGIRHGSEIIFSDGRMIGKDGNVVDGLVSVDFSDKEFYEYFQTLPVRQHVRINHRGVSADGGKFDEQVVFKGTRFCFEIEMLSSDNGQKDNFNLVIEALKNESFRIGSGTRNGFGEIKTCSLKIAELDLKKKKDLQDYLDKTSCLNDANWPRWEDRQCESCLDNQYDRYELWLKPDDFFLFGSGVGDDEADMTPVRVNFIDWKENKPRFETEAVLIPGSSVKGALAHRVAFYYNIKHIKNKYSEGELENITNGCSDGRTENFYKLSDNELENLSGNNNRAVQELFGYIQKNDSERKMVQQPGNVMISDVILEKRGQEKLLNHVAIDRFTGGTIDGALFTEKVIYDNMPEPDYLIRIFVRRKEYSEGVVEALEKALEDICTGMLPLGGGVNRGNGCFRGYFKKK